VSLDGPLQSALPFVVVELAIGIDLGEQPPAQSSLPTFRQLSRIMKRGSPKTTDGSDLPGSLRVQRHEMRPPATRSAEAPSANTEGRITGQPDRSRTVTPPL
jgi:hypothetical protein